MFTEGWPRLTLRGLGFLSLLIGAGREVEMLHGHSTSPLYPLAIGISLVLLSFIGIGPPC